MVRKIFFPHTQSRSLVSRVVPSVVARSFVVIGLWERVWSVLVSPTWQFVVYRLAFYGDVIPYWLPLDLNILVYSCVMEKKKPYLVVGFGWEGLALFYCVLITSLILSFAANPIVISELTWFSDLFQ